VSTRSVKANRHIFHAWTVGALCFAMACPLGWGAEADRDRSADILEVDFENGLPEFQELPPWLDRISFHNGALKPHGGSSAWVVDANQTIGEGRVDFWLKRDFLPDALAVVIAFDDLDGTDLAVQLFDDAGQVVAVDLFGNLAETRIAGASDTFVVPLRKYPTATRATVRRIQGPLVLTGLAAFPVVEELDALTGSEEAALERLLSAADAQFESADSALRVRRERDLSISNTIASDVLGVAGYPRANWQPGVPTGEMFSIYVSGTAYRFVTNILMKLFRGEADFDEKIFFTSSDHSAEALASGDTGVAIVSRLPTDAQLAEFKNRTGHAPIIVPIALDAVEVLVHPTNALTAIRFDELREMFGAAGGAKAWAQFPGSSLTGAISLVGGWPSWGTSRSFAQAIGLSGDFSPEMEKRDIAFPSGVEAFVSETPLSIGFAQYRPRIHAVKSLPVISAPEAEAIGVSAETVYGGTYPLTRQLYMVLGWESPAQIPPPVRVFIDLLLSHEGQTQVALAGNFPLERSAVSNSRATLDVP